MHMIFGPFGALKFTKMHIATLASECTQGSGHLGFTSCCIASQWISVMSQDFWGGQEIHFQNLRALGPRPTPYPDMAGLF